jgi:hypothetical protein
MAEPEYIGKNLIRIMLGSADLRSEKEFADFYLAPLPLLKAAARRFRRFRRRAKRAARRDVEVNVSIYDDFRIAVLNDLDTPELRQELQRRLGQCIDRLKYGHDEDKIEIVMFLSMFLSDAASKIFKGRRRIPLGSYGLMTVIYEDSFNRAMETVPRARDMVDEDMYELWCAEHREKDLVIIESTLERLDVFEALAVCLERDHTLAQAWERQKLYLSERIWVRVASGAMSFEPSFFAPDEIVLAIDKMEERYWRKVWSPSRYVVFLAVSNLVMCIQEVMDEVMSPQRIVQLTDALNAVGQKCLESDDEQKRSWLPGIQALIDDLQKAEYPSQSRVVQALYMQGFMQALNEVDAPSPHWQRFLKLLGKSRLFRQFSEEEL